MIHIKLLIGIIIYKSITIRCTKCQIFGIWHTKHKKQILMRRVKCEKIMKHATIPFHLWHGTNQNGIWCLLFLFSFLSPLSSLYSFFLGSDLMGGFDSGCLFSLPFTLATPPDVDLCVFCCCFCFSVVVVWVFYCVIFGVRRWWVGCGWGVDGC